MRYLILFFATMLFFSCQRFELKFKDYKDLKLTVFEESAGKKSSDYHETIAYYQYLGKQSKQLELHEIGETDSPEPLHLMVWSYEGRTTLKDLENRKNKALVFINNGIHPGEPDGVDASQILLKKLICDSLMAKAYKDVMIAIIPIYNVGGALNRNGVSRVNQNGPEAYGFRGNAQNYDLNRDFIKLDSKNAWTLTKTFAALSPNLFIDTHVSNGADYPYNITLLANHKNTFQSGLEAFLQNDFTPALYQSMQDKAEPMVPYVNVHGTDPSEGITEFLDLPRYSNGYAALHHCPAFTIETHMLKSHKVRTEATLDLLETLLTTTAEKREQLLDNIQAEKAWYKNNERLPISWGLGPVNDSLLFKGYVYETQYNEVFATKQKVYNRKKMYEAYIPFQNNYQRRQYSIKPKFYIVQGGYASVIERLQNHGVEGRFYQDDSVKTVQGKRIVKYETINQPFEGHYLHYSTQCEDFTEEWMLRKGDFLIDVEKNNARLLAELLSPEAPDAFFNWGFFDSILQQKEGFSGYVWQQEAEDIVRKDHDLFIAFSNKKVQDSAFANNYNAQLRWLYMQSEHYEKAHMRLPIYQLMK